MSLFSDTVGDSIDEDSIDEDSIDDGSIDEELLFSGDVSLSSWLFLPSLLARVSLPDFRLLIIVPFVYLIAS